MKFHNLLITGSLFAAATIVVPSSAQAQQVHTDTSATVLTFDDAYSDLGDAGDPASFYSSEGVTIGGTFFGVVGGIGNGDPGAWSLEGTNGSAFLGCNSGDLCSPTFAFAQPVQDVSLDLGLANHWSASFTVSGYLNGALVGSDTSTISDFGQAGGTWETFFLNGTFDSVIVTDRFSGSGFAFGLDNVTAVPISAVPEPSSWAMMLIGFGGFGFAMRRQRKHALNEIV